MNSKSMNEIKEWWNACPSKGITVLVSLLLVLIASNCAYELGVGFGTFIYHIMH